MDERSDALERALGYPYAVPAWSFVQLGDRTLDPTTVDVDLSARVPLLAYGSNAAPEVLARKLGDDPDPVPVIRAALGDFDVVYSAHISTYGAVPATLRRSPGAEAAASVAYLTAPQLRLISGTEPNYELRRLRGVSCRLEGGDSRGDLFAYLSRHGSLLLDGSEVALSRVRTRRRRFRAMSQRQVLERVRDILRPELSLERFILECASGALPVQESREELARAHSGRAS